jgi:hypothetical protein
VIPKTNDEFSKFMSDSKSGVCGKSDDSRATSLDALTPFQQLHKTTQHALAFLVMNKYSFLSPGIDISFTTIALQYEFPHDTATKRTVPSSLRLSDVSLTFKYTSPLRFHAIANSRPDMHRPLIYLSIHTCGLEWSAIGSKMADEEHPPAFANNSLVGIISKASAFGHLYPYFIIFLAHIRGILSHIGLNSNAKRHQL